MKSLKATFCALSALAFCHASALVLDLGSGIQFGHAGQTISFSGTLINDSANTVFINGGNYTTNSPDMAVDAMPFLLNAPLTMGPGEHTLAFEMFRVSILSSSAGTVFSGSFSVIGGSTESSTDNLDERLFSVVAPESNSAVPALVALAGFALYRKRC